MMGFKYDIEITGYLHKEDGGYWSETKLHEFAEKCDDARLIQVFIKEGNGEMKPFPCKVKIKRVIVDIE